MTHWTDIAGIVFAAVTMNHLGLVAAAEGVIRHSLPVLDCPKCLTFWAVLGYGCLVCCDSIAALPAALPRLLAISFLCSYAAIWLELLEGFIDSLYAKLYEKIYPDTPDDAPAPAADDGHP